MSAEKGLHAITQSSDMAEGTHVDIKWDYISCPFNVLCPHLIFVKIDAPERDKGELESRVGKESDSDANFRGLHVVACSCIRECPDELSLVERSLASMLFAAALLLHVHTECTFAVLHAYV